MPCGTHTQVCLNCEEEIEDAKPVVRKMRAAYKDRDRIRIVEAANVGEDWQTLAVVRDMPYKTAVSWVYSGRSTFLPKANGNQQRQRYSEAEIDVIVGHLEGDPTITLWRVATERYNLPEISLTTMATYLNGRSYSYKGLHKQSVAMNSEDSKWKRKEYAEKLLE